MEVIVGDSKVLLC